MEVFEVVQPGPLTTVQDLGRKGYQQCGVPTSGALDDYAFRVGNILVGNNEDAASLEITLFGCQLRVLQGTTIAITGADLVPKINGAHASNWESIRVKCGDVLSFPQLNSGCRAYLAVAGGICVPRVMRSASTYVRAGIGGLFGRSLRKGDILQANDSPSSCTGARVPSETIPVYGNQITLRTILGPQDDYFTEQGIHTFLNSKYTVTSKADRMGYCLDGPSIQHKAEADIISDGIPLGAIQVPGDGLPIILLADRQTTGGYTKIGTTISVDISRVAQAKPGDSIRFERVDEEEAVTLLFEYERQVALMKSHLHA